MMRTFASFTGKQIAQNVKAKRGTEEKLKRIGSVIDTKAFSIFYQPIIDVEKNRITGFESLSRFPMEPRRTPDLWFREAEEVGLGEQLEMAAMQRALVALDQLSDDVYLALNCSPKHIISGAIENLLRRAPLERIVLEITEHAAVVDYSELVSRLSPLRQQGLRLAVDDAGAGYASFLHIIMLNPDFIKLDRSLIRDIDTHTKQQALASAIITFAEQTGSGIIAEGVETESELKTLKALGVVNVQGYLLGRPAEMSAAMEFLGMQDA